MSHDADDQLRPVTMAGEAIGRAAAEHMAGLRAFSRGMSLRFAADTRRWDDALARLDAMIRAKEAPVTEPKPLNLEQLVHDLRTAEADEARASQANNGTYDVLLGVIAALDRTASDLAAAVLSAERVARAQGMVEGVALVLRGHTGTLAEDDRP